MALTRLWSTGLAEFLGQIRSRHHAGRQFEINLSSRYRVEMVTYRTWLMCGCIGLLLSIGWNIWQGVMIYQESQIIATELERVRQLDHMVMDQAKNEGIDLSEGALRRLSSEVDLANQLLEKRTFSWTRFLTELEQAIPPSLALTSIRLDQAGKIVQLTGTATNLEEVTAFTVGLENHATFKNPVLAQHRVGSSGLVEFDVTVQYRQTGV